MRVCVCVCVFIEKKNWEKTGLKKKKYVGVFIMEKGRKNAKIEKKMKNVCVCARMKMLTRTHFLQKAIMECDEMWAQNKKLVDTRQKGLRNSVRG